MLEKERKEFVEAVEKAFMETEYPGDDDIVYKTSLHLDDSRTTLKSFQGKHWRDISLDTLVLNRDHLPFFAPRAYRFYLPAFLIASILHFEKVDVLKNNTLYSLTPPLPEDSWYSSFHEQVSGFEPAQRHVIRVFLKLYAKLDPSALLYDPHKHLQRATRFWSESDT